MESAPSDDSKSKSEGVAGTMVASAIPSGSDSRQPGTGQANIREGSRLSSISSVSRPESGARRRSSTGYVQDRERPSFSTDLATSLGFASWPHSDAALVEALRAKAEQERTRQELHRVEGNRLALKVLELAASLGVSSETIPLLFSDNDEHASKLVAQLSNASVHQAGGAEAGQQQQVTGLQNPQAHAQRRLSRLSPQSGGGGFTSPRTPTRTSVLTSPVDLGPQSQHHHATASTPTFVNSGPVASTYTTPQQSTGPMQIQQSQSVPFHHHHQQQAHSHHSSLSYESRDSATERPLTGHRQALSSLPAFGPMSPQGYPLGALPGRAAVPGFYPSQLIAPRMPQLQSMSTPPISTQQPQQQQSQQPHLLHHHAPPPPPPQQQQHPQQQQPQSQSAQPFRASMGPISGPAPLGVAATPIVSAPVLSEGVAMHMVSPTSPTHVVPQSLPQAAPPGSQAHPFGPPLGSAQPPALSSQDSRASAKRPLAPYPETKGAKASGRGRGHRHSLSMGTDLQIHQWKPKQLLRDNRWKISNPFSRTKASVIKANEQASQSAGVAQGSASQTKAAPDAPATSSGPVAAQSPTFKRAEEGTVSIPATLTQQRSSDTHEVTPTSPKKLKEQARVEPPVTRPENAPSSAAVVAAHNNKRRSMTHARRRSAASYSLDASVAGGEGEDEHRRDEGVAVLASLASEQQRRDSDARKQQPSFPVVPATGSSSTISPRKEKSEDHANVPAPVQPQDLAHAPVK